MGGTLRVLALFVAALSYIWAIGAFGYEISTAAIALFALWMFGLRKPLGLMAVAIPTTIPALYRMDGQWNITIPNCATSSRSASDSILTTCARLNPGALREAG